jgi:hypothetical protein
MNWCRELAVIQMSNLRFCTTSLNGKYFIFGEAFPQNGNLNVTASAFFIIESMEVPKLFISLHGTLLRQPDAKEALIFS